MNKNLFVMVTGPAASGKSTLCDNLCVRLPAFFYKPSKAYFDLAKKKNIPQDRAFSDIFDDEIYSYLCNVYLQHKIVVGDQHLSIQPVRDSAFAINKTIDVDYNEPYVSALNYKLFDELSANNIKTLVIYLKASVDNLYCRAQLRNTETGFPIRNTTLSQVYDEVVAEEYYFNELLKNTGIGSLIINTDDKSKEQIFNYASAYIKKY